MLNSVHLIGRLGKDVEMRYTPQGKAVSSFSIAVEGYNKEKKPEWVNIVAWEKTAENCNQYLHKGSLVFVGGRLQTREYEDKNGVKRWITEVVANRVQFLDTKPSTTTESKQNEPTQWERATEKQVVPDNYDPDLGF